MRIWVDADSCPRQVRDIVVRAANREKKKAVFVANREIPVMDSPYCEMIVVAKKADEADRYIIDKVEQGDLVVTRDIPMAAEIVEKGVMVINDRGDAFTTENIRERLSIRNVMKEYREAGIIFDLDKTYSNKEVQKFANAFDRELRKLL